MNNNSPRSPSPRDPFLAPYHHGQQLPVQHVIIHQHNPSLYTHAAYQQTQPTSCSEDASRASFVYTTPWTSSATLESTAGHRQPPNTSIEHYYEVQQNWVFGREGTVYQHQNRGYVAPPPVDPRLVAQVSGRELPDRTTHGKIKPKSASSRGRHESAKTYNGRQTVHPQQSGSQSRHDHKPAVVGLAETMGGYPSSLEWIIEEGSHGYRPELQRTQSTQRGRHAPQHVSGQSTFIVNQQQPTLNQGSQSMLQGRFSIFRNSTSLGDEE
jgi:hypothetical protein